MSEISPVWVCVMWVWMYNVCVCVCVWVYVCGCGCVKPILLSVHAGSIQVGLKIAMSSTIINVLQ